MSVSLFIEFVTDGNNVGQLNRPTDVTYLNDDNILVADQLNHRIQQFNVQTGNSVKSFGKKRTRDGVSPQFTTDTDNY